MGSSVFKSILIEGLKPSQMPGPLEKKKYKERGAQTGTGTLNIAANYFRWYSGFW